jgi:crossover junction endodeoxyribonuclease RusA
MNEQKIEIYYDDLQALSQNQYYMHSLKKGSSVFLSSKGREYREKLREKLPLQKIEGRVKLEIIAFFKDNRKRDLDNINKPLIDALKNFVIEDDDQIFELIMKKSIGVGYNAIKILIEPLQ